MAEQTRKQSLSNELREARSELAGFVAVVRNDLDVGARLKSNYSRNPGTWFGVAAGIGLLLARILLPRRKVVAKLPHGWSVPVQKTGKLAVVVTALKFVFGIAQPALAHFIQKRIERRAAAHDAKK